MKGSTVRKYCLVFFIFMSLNFCLHCSGYAQVGGPGDPGGDEDVPITGIEWLLLGGGALGARQYYRKIRKRS